MTLVKTCEPHEPTAPAVHEELTAVERGVLCGALRSRVSVGRKALRIIDRLAAELKASRDFWVDSKQREIEARIAAESRAEALQARTAELEAQLPDSAGPNRIHRNPVGPHELVHKQFLVQLKERAEALQARVAELESYLEACPRCSYPCGDSCTNCSWSSSRITSESELATTKARVAELEARVAELEARIERQRAANRGMQRSLDERGSEITQLRSTLDRVRNERAEWAADATNNKRSWLKAESELADLRGRVREALELLTGVEGEMVRFTREVLRGL